jgi:hypothetical protein
LGLRFEANLVEELYDFAQSEVPTVVGVNAHLQMLSFVLAEVVLHKTEYIWELLNIDSISVSDVECFKDSFDLSNIVFLKDFLVFIMGTELRLL